MRCIHRQSRYALATLIFTALSVTGASAGVIYSDNFSSDTVGSPPSGWFLDPGTSGVTDNVVNDTTLINEGNAVDFNETGASTRFMLTNFTSQSLAVGDSLSFTFKVAVATTSIPQYDRLFRFGIWNDNGTPVTVSGSSQTNFSDDKGYMDRLDVGAEPSGTLSADTYQANGSVSSLFNTTKSLGGSSSNAAYTLNDNNVHTLTITLTRTDANTITNAFTLDGLPTLTGTDGTAPTFSFDEIALGLTSPTSGLDFHVDDVSVTYTAAVPEPASASLVGVAVAGLFIRRRRRSEA